MTFPLGSLHSDAAGSGKAADRRAEPASHPRTIGRLHRVPKTPVVAPVEPLEQTMRFQAALLLAVGQVGDLQAARVVLVFGFALLVGGRLVAGLQGTFGQLQVILQLLVQLLQQQRLLIPVLTQCR